MSVLLALQISPRDQEASERGRCQDITRMSDAVNDPDVAVAVNNGWYWKEDNGTYTRGGGH
jgi:hypothetical protein